MSASHALGAPIPAADEPSRDALGAARRACRHHHGRQWPLGRRPRPAARRRPPRRRPGACAAPSRRRSAHGVDWLTLYAFSSENWRRPAGEVSDLTGLLRHYLRTEIAELTANGVRLRFIGDRGRFDADIARRAGRAPSARPRQRAAEPDHRAVLRRAAPRSSPPRARSPRPRVPGGSIPRRSTRRRSPASSPPPACPIRTWSSAPAASSGCRTSCSGSAAYAELVFLDVLWPDFGPRAFRGGARRICPAGAAVRCACLADPRRAMTRRRPGADAHVRWGDLRLRRGLGGDPGAAGAGLPVARAAPPGPC